MILMNDNQILKNYIKEKRYPECISILKNKIVSFVIKQIQANDTTIKFTTVSDLISESDFYLKDSSIAKSLKTALLMENPLEQIEDLLLICEQNGIK